VDPLNTKYFEVIKKPMDFVTIYEKSYRNFDELVDDVTLLMKNCLQYNLPNSKIYRRTLQTEKIFGLLMPMLRPFAEMAEIQVMKYSERECGLVT
jgi:hypothetical protein